MNDFSSEFSMRTQICLGSIGSIVSTDESRSLKCFSVHQKGRTPILLSLVEKGHVKSNPRFGTRVFSERVIYELVAETRSGNVPRPLYCRLCRLEWVQSTLEVGVVGWRRPGPCVPFDRCTSPQRLPRRSVISSVPTLTPVVDDLFV